MRPDDTPVTSSSQRLDELRSSAKGWHGVQLAALGFIGLCGVLQTGESSDPVSLQALAGILVLIAFVFACAGIYLVGRAAWPLYGAAPDSAGTTQSDVERASHELRRGLLMTFVSIALVALATTTSWWPTEDEASDGAGRVEVQATSGESFCGELAAASQAGAVRIVTAARPVELELARLAAVRPASDC